MEQERHGKKRRFHEFLENYYELSKNGTDIKTEIIAGMTTFLTMAYVLAVIPGFLREAGIPEGGLYTSVCLIAMLGTLMHALFSKLPVATAPGLGLTVFFVSTVVGRMGYTWQQGLAAVTISGVVLVLVTASSVRRIVLDGLPENIKTAITAGVGLFIALIGLKSSGIIIATETGLFLGNFKESSVQLSVFGLLLMLILMARNVKGALIISIIATTLLGIPMGVTDLSKWHGFVLPGGLGDLFFKQDFKGLLGQKDVFSGLINIVMIVLTISMVDFFDKIGTLLAIASKGKLYNEKGEVKNMKRALLCESTTTIISSFFGATTTSTYLECTAGIAEGGRTGLTAMTTAVLFAASLLLSPIFLAIPSFATAPALIVVGFYMFSNVVHIDFSDMTEAIPCYICIVAMPLFYSISEGISMGIISYVFINAVTGRAKKVTPLMYILSILFILKYILL